MRGLVVAVCAAGRGACSSVAGRGWALGVAWVLGFTPGCGASLSELLLDALCEDDGDCASGQRCVRTPYQQLAGAQGWCRSDESCSTGHQPGCACDQVGAEFRCEATTEPGLVVSAQDAACVCEYRCDTFTWGESSGCPNGLAPTMPGDLSDPDCRCSDTP